LIMRGWGGRVVKVWLHLSLSGKRTETLWLDYIEDLEIWARRDMCLEIWEGEADVDSLLHIPCA
jgi:hypothetical protein